MSNCVEIDDEAVDFRNIGSNHDTVDGFEILHHLGWLTPYKSWDKPSIN